MDISRFESAPSGHPLIGIEDPLTRTLDGLLCAVQTFVGAAQQVRYARPEAPGCARGALRTLNARLASVAGSPRPVAQVKTFYQMLGKLFEGEPGVVAPKTCLFASLDHDHVARFQQLVTQMLGQDLSLLHASIQQLPEPGAQPNVMAYRYEQRLCALRGCCVDAAQQQWATLLWASLFRYRTASQRPAGPDSAWLPAPVRMTPSEAPPMGRPRVTVEVGFKVKRAPPAPDGSTGPELSVLVGTCGAAYLMGRTVAAGVSGKVRYAQALTGELMAIKEVRERPSMSHGGDGGARQATKLRDIIIETRQLREARGVVDQAFRRIETAQHAWSKPLRRLRSAPLPFLVEDLIRVPAQQKIYLPMTCLTGDLSQLCYQLKTPLAMQGTVLSVAVQMSAELMFLHENAGYIHCDIKLENMGVGANGQVMLLDFGLAQCVKGADRKPRSGIWGTVLAPEMCPPPHAPKSQTEITQAIDIFALAVSLFELEAIWFDASNPFILGKQTHPVLAGSYEPQVRTLFDRYACWRAARRSVHYPRCLDLMAIVQAAEARDASRAPADAELALFDAFFAPLIRIRPELSALLLNHALRINPQERVTARVLADTLMPEVQAMPSAELEAYQQAVAAQVEQRTSAHFAAAPRENFNSALRAAALIASKERRPALRAP